MRFIPIIQGALVGTARDLRDTLPDDLTGGRRYPYYVLGELVLGVIAARYLPEQWDNLGLAVVGIGAKDSTG